MCASILFFFFSSALLKYFKANSRPSVVSFLHTSYPSQKIMGISSHYQKAISFTLWSFTKRKAYFTWFPWTVFWGVWNPEVDGAVFVFVHFSEERASTYIFKFSVTALEVTDAHLWLCMWSPEVPFSFSDTHRGLQALKTSCLCSHLPTHSITAHPMVTIRISDRQRLIQPYIHNYSWLLFAALALYSAHLASAEDVDGEKLDPQVRSSAATLRSRCLQLVGDCLMKAHQGKGRCSSGSETKPALNCSRRNSRSRSETQCSVWRRQNPVFHKRCSLWMELYLFIY